MSANEILHWHLDVLSPEGRALDSSDNHLNGVVSGDPKNQPDERFGSVLRFNGSPDSVGVPDTPVLRLTTYTVEAWVCPDPLGQAGLIGKPPGDFRVLLNADGSVEHRFGTKDKVDQGHRTAAGAVGGGSWHYVAVTNDGSTARIFIDGVQASEYAFTGGRVAAQVPLLAGSDGGTTGPGKGPAYFTGELAHIRIYDGALNETEIRRDMADDEASLAVFVRTHPIGFNLSGQDGQPVLFINETTTAQQTMTLRIINASRQDLVPQPLTGGASADNHHYALRLRAGTLAAGSRPAVTDPGWSLLQAADSATGDTILYLKGDAPPEIRRGESYDLHLGGLNADAAGGTRGTRVELTYRRIRYAGEQDELTGGRVQFIDVVNHRGLHNIPLTACFVGGDRLINDGQTANTLRIRIANSSRDKALAFGGASFTLSYDVQASGETHEWALVGVASAKTAAVTLRADKVSADWKITSESLGQRVQWTLTPNVSTAFDAGGSLVVTLAGVVALSSLGQAPIVIGYRNVPGYQDGSITLVAEKAPLLFSGQNVGIGTTTPGSRLTISAGSEHLQLRREPAPAGSPNVLFLELFQQDSTSPIYPSLRFHHSNHFWHRIEGRPEGLAVKTGVIGNDDLSDLYAGTANLRGLTVGGNAGIGTTAPEARLQIVNADQDPSGNTLILGPTTASNLRLGYNTDYSWIQSHGSKPLAINAIGNNVGIGTTTPGSRLTISSDSAHLQLRREAAPAGNPNVLFLELFQNDSTNSIYPSLRFHHSNHFWHRIEGRPEGLAIKTGAIDNETMSDLYAATAHLQGLTIGTVTIGQAELAILKRLAAGQLQCDLWNVAQNEYAYAADYSPFDNDRRYVFTWRTKGERVSQGRWQISFPG